MIKGPSAHIQETARFGGGMEGGREEETPAVLCLKQSDVFGLWQERQTPSLNRKIPPSAAFCS